VAHRDPPSCPTRRSSDLKNYRFRRISEPLVRYYWHGNQISTNFEAVYKGHLAILQKYKEEIMKLGSWALARHYLRLGHCLRNAGDRKSTRLNSSHVKISY